MKKLLLALCFLANLAQATTHHFLWVVDNSASMAKQRELLGQSIEVFLSKLQEKKIVDWTMGITSTDFFEHKGHLYPPELSAPALVTSKMEKPAEVFRQFLGSIKESPTSFWEQGLEASIATLKTFPESFLVANEPLSVIYISDEDDYSCQSDCFGVEPENNANFKPYAVERYIDFFRELKDRKNINVSIFPIVGILEGTCSVASYGTRYLKLRAAMQSGVAGSVCPSDFVRSLLNIPSQLSNVQLQPPHWTEEPIFFRAVSDVPFSAELAPFAVGNKLQFRLVSGPNWIHLSPLGTVSGIPKVTDIGMDEMIVRLIDPKGQTADTQIKITVMQGSNHSPKWMGNPLKLGGIFVGDQFLKRVDELATDADGDDLTVSLLSGPIWLKIGHVGDISGASFLQGIPTHADLGLNRLTLRVCDTKMSCDHTWAEIIVTKH